MSTPFNNRIDKQVLFRTRPARICVKAKVPENRRLPSPLITSKGLKNSAHGALHPFRDVHIDFCDIKLNGCFGTTPGGSTPQTCPQLTPGQDIQLCSSLTVPEIAPAGLTVDITWKVLREPENGDAVDV